MQRARGNRRPGLSLHLQHGVMSDKHARASRALPICGRIARTCAAPGGCGQPSLAACAVSSGHMPKSRGGTQPSSAWGTPTPSRAARGSSTPMRCEARLTHAWRGSTPTKSWPHGDAARRTVAQQQARAGHGRGTHDHVGVHLMRCARHCGESCRIVRSRGRHGQPVQSR